MAVETVALEPSLNSRIMTALTTNPFISERGVRIDTEDGRVTLRGNVKSFFQKQMAQEALRRVDGIESIDNLLEVNWT